MDIDPDDGLELHPFRALRFTVGPDRLGARLCPPYDVIDPDQRAELVAADPDNAVTVVLPESKTDADPYQEAAATLRRWVSDGVAAVDETPALYVYEMSDGARHHPGSARRRRAA